MAELLRATDGGVEKKLLNIPNIDFVAMNMPSDDELLKTTEEDSLSATEDDLSTIISENELYTQDEESLDLSRKFGFAMAGVGVLSLVTIAKNEQQFTSVEQTMYAAGALALLYLVSRSLLPQSDSLDDTGVLLPREINPDKYAKLASLNYMSFVSTQSGMV